MRPSAAVVRLVSFKVRNCSKLPSTSNTPLQQPIAMIDLARKAGFFCEPTGAASPADARRPFADSSIAATDDVVCIVTGHEFKDFAAWNTGV